jgi:ribosomal protein S27AE
LTRDEYYLSINLNPDETFRLNYSTYSQFVMGTYDQFKEELFRGLSELAEASFPKKCPNCGRVFETAEQFLLETQDMGLLKSGLKQSEDDDGHTIVEAFRNCPCGSTLMEFFADRRDMTEAGNKRRNKFNELLDYLERNEIDRAIARRELLKVMKGEKSDILSKISTPEKK